MLNRLLCLILFISIIPSGVLRAQICAGNFGENIFTEGDFGRGASNVLPTDPGIAPGFIYQVNPPPNDGFYTITNNTTAWGSFAESSWIDIGDNSSDPQGYMMVVNATIEPGLFYEERITGLCEEILYEFSADVINLIFAGRNEILPNVSFLIDGEVVFETGPIPENEQWNTYGFTFTTRPGQNAVTLALKNNAPGGQGNDLALDNITFRPCGPEALILPFEVANICEDGNPIDLNATIIGSDTDSIFLQWQQSFNRGATWSDLPGENDPTFMFDNLNSGMYYYRYLLANTQNNLLNPKCPINSNIKVVNVIPKFVTVFDTICQGNTFPFGVQDLSIPGVYVDTFKNIIGCDSIVTLNLGVADDNQLEAAFDVSDPSCTGFQTGSIDLQLVNGNPPFSIQVNGEENFNQGDLNNLPPGVYHYFITDRFGCTAEASVELVNPPLFTIDIGDDVQLDLGESLEITTLATDDIDTYSWEPPELIDCETDCDVITITPSRSTTIALSALSESGCIARDSFRVEVNTVRTINIPNAFSPNGDGINDFFTVFGEQPNIQEIERMIIVDRNGKEVFQNDTFKPNDGSTAWDGTKGSQQLPSGVYYYTTSVRYLDDEVLSYKGFVVLLK